MAAIPPPRVDPTLEAVDRALEARENANPPRNYLGMSSIGHECERKNWLDFRWATKAKFGALSLKRFADGHMGEDLQAKRLRMVDGIELHIVAEDGKQLGFKDFDDHFGGHMDGVVLGLIQAPKTWHIWEHKSVAEDKQVELEKLIIKHGEKNALKLWNIVYYAQAVLYMDYAELDRHYMTVSSPGGRHTISVRTDANKEDAIRYRAKAERVINSPRPPVRISKDPTWFQCKMCDHHPLCHGDVLPPGSCRTCMHSSPAENAIWNCQLKNIPLDVKAQKEACPRHLYLPDLVPGEQVDADERGEWVEYRMRDGNKWTDGIPF
jgi:hypothetical protein